MRNPTKVTVFGIAAFGIVTAFYPGFPDGSVPLQCPAAMLAALFCSVA